MPLLGPGGIPTVDLWRAARDRGCAGTSKSGRPRRPALLFCSVSFNTLDLCEICGGGFMMIGDEIYCLLGAWD